MQLYVDLTLRKQMGRIGIRGKIIDLHLAVILYAFHPFRRM